MIKRYYKYLQRSAYTLPHDITQTYHRIIDLLFKFLGLGLGIYGTYKIILEGYEYYIYSHTPINEKLPLAEKVFDHTVHFNDTIIGMTIGFGALVGAVFVSLILVVRHLSQTLPDHIYLRCFASLEEKRKRLPIND